jgi:hypothetical protein
VNFALTEFYEVRGSKVDQILDILGYRDGAMHTTPKHSHEIGL